MVLELAFVLVAGAAFAGLAAFALADFHLAGSSFRQGFIATNFRDYCAGIVVLADGRADWFPPRRARLGGLLPAWFLAREGGVLHALGMASLVASGLMGSGIYLWARALHGRLAGGLAVVVALSLAPLVLVTRLFSFYPEIAALLCLAPAVCTLALRSRKLWAVALGAVLVGLLLDVDARGVVWAGFDLVILGLAVLRLPGWGRRLAGVLVVGLCLLGSWELGSWSYPAKAHSLEHQVSVDELHSIRSGETRDPRQKVVYGGEFVWGHSPPARWPDTVSFLLSQSSSRPLEAARSEDEERLLIQHLDPLLPVAVVALLGGALALRRRPWLLLGLCVGTAPFLLALNGIYATNELRVRFLSQVLPPLAVWLGVGLSGLLEAAWARLPWRRPGAAWVASAAVLTLGLLLVLGVLPSPASPVASWRLGWTEANAHVTQVIGSVRDGPPPGDHCATRMMQEQDAGQDAFRSDLYGREAVR